MELSDKIIKLGSQITIKNNQETQRIVGTYTNDANAVANDIISGKTAYVKGKKITGNISKRTGNIWNGNPYVSGNYLYSNLSNGYYENAKIEMSKGNLSPENIRQGVNIFGVNGTFSNDGANVAFIVYCSSSQDSGYRYYHTYWVHPVLSGYVNQIKQNDSGTSGFSRITIQRYCTLQFHSIVRHPWSILEFRGSDITDGQTISFSSGDYLNPVWDFRYTGVTMYVAVVK